MNIKWEADIYDKAFSFVHQYGEDVLNLLDLPAGGRVIDLGCGSGALTRRLADAGFAVTGVDASAEMLEQAKALHPSLRFVLGDALHYRPDTPADAVFSNAVFHWIDDQDGLLRNIAAMLREGGQLVCEFGGRGCCERIHRALQTGFEARGIKYRRTFYFPTVGEYAPKMEAAGLMVTYAVLFERPTRLSGADGLRDWIRMFVKLPFEGVAPDMREAIIREAETRLRPELYRDGSWYADYVRIRLRAVKTGR